MARRTGLGADRGKALAPLLAKGRAQESRAAAWAATQRRATAKEDPLRSALLTAASSHADDETRLWALRALVAQGARRLDLSFLLEKLGDSSPAVREVAASAFSERGVR